MIHSIKNIYITLSNSCLKIHNSIQFPQNFCQNFPSIHYWTLDKARKAAFSRNTRYASVCSRFRNFLACGRHFVPARRVTWRLDREMAAQSWTEIQIRQRNRMKKNSCQTCISTRTRFLLMEKSCTNRNDDGDRKCYSAWWIYRVVKATRKFIGGVNMQVWLSDTIEKLWVKINETTEDLRGIYLLAVLNWRPFIFLL